MCPIYRCERDKINTMFSSQSTEVTQVVSIPTELHDHILRYGPEPWISVSKRYQKLAKTALSSSTTLQEQWKSGEFLDQAGEKNNTSMLKFFLELKWELDTLPLHISVDVFVNVVGYAHMKRYVTLDHIVTFFPSLGDRMIDVLDLSQEFPRGSKGNIHFSSLSLIIRYCSIEGIHRIYEGKEIPSDIQLYLRLVEHIMTGAFASYYHSEAWVPRAIQLGLNEEQLERAYQILLMRSNSLSLSSTTVFEIKDESILLRLFKESWTGPSSIVPTYLQRTPEEQKSYSQLREAILSHTVMKDAYLPWVRLTVENSDIYLHVVKHGYRYGLSSSVPREVVRGVLGQESELYILLDTIVRESYNYN